MIAFFILFSLSGQAHQENLFVTKQPEGNPPDTRPTSHWQKKPRRIKHTKKKGESIIFQQDVHLTTTGFRYYPELKQSPNPSKHLFFVGCSYTFGEGLSDNQTFVYQLAEAFPKANTINFGRRGAGIFEHFFYWKYFRWNEILPQHQGTMIYTIFGDHLERMQRSWRYLDWANGSTPQFVKTASTWSYDGLLDQKVSYKLTNILKGIHLEYFWLLGQYHLLDFDMAQSEYRMADALAELKRDYLKQYPQGRFVVSWLAEVGPHTRNTSKAKFMQALDYFQVEYWDNSLPAHEQVDLKKEKYQISQDGHPNAYSNQLYAQFLINKLKNSPLSERKPPLPHK